MIHALIISWTLAGGTSYTVIPFPTHAACEEARIKVVTPKQQAACFEVKAPPDPIRVLRGAVRRTT